MTKIRANQSVDNIDVKSNLMITELSGKEKDAPVYGSVSGSISRRSPSPKRPKA